MGSILLQNNQRLHVILIPNLRAARFVPIAQTRIAKIKAMLL